MEVESERVEYPRHPECDGNHKRLCKFDDCEWCYNRSFASHPKAECWHESNEDSPRDVTKGTHQKRWFQCDNEECNHIFDSPIHTITNKKNHWCPYCSNKKLCGDELCNGCFIKSFASHPRSIYLENDNPLIIFKGSNNEHNFRCNVCHHIFVTIIYDVTREENTCWCPYCSNHQLCSDENCIQCFNKSFASHPRSKHWHKNNKGTPRDIFKQSHEKKLFFCNQCSHMFEASPSKITNNCDPRWCPFCSNPPQKLCKKSTCDHCFRNSFASHSRSKYWHRDNEDSPRNVFISSKHKKKFQCDKNHLFETTLNSVSSKGSWCPYCKHKTEDKLYNYLTSIILEVQRQLKFDWCKSPLKSRSLPYDFLVDDSIIIELDGRQHFEQVSNWQSHIVTSITDRYKEKKALENGYSIIRLLQEEVFDDITSIDHNGNEVTWQSLLLAAIDRVGGDVPSITYISSAGAWPGLEGSYTMEIEYEPSSIVRV